MAELLDSAKVREGQLFVVGCSTSEVMGKKIGTDSHIDVAQILFDEIYKAVKAKGLNWLFNVVSILIELLLWNVVQ